MTPKQDVAEIAAEIVSFERWSSVTFTGWTVRMRGTVFDAETEFKIPGYLLAGVSTSGPIAEILLVRADDKLPSVAATKAALLRAAIRAHIIKQEA